MNQKILSVHHLRGIAAILVVFFHFRSFLNGVYSEHPNLGTALFGSGAFGVDLFFMISGFIIALATARPVTPVIFLARRFFRIYPLFILVFIVGAVTVYSKNTATDLIRSAFFIHRNYNESSPGFGFNILGPAWTLSYEIYFYFIFMISMLISHKNRMVISSTFIVLPIIILQFMYSDGFSLSANASPVIPKTNFIHDELRFIGSPILIEFVIGMALYFAYNSQLKMAHNIARSILLFCVTCFLCMYFFSPKYGFGMTSFGVWSLILILGFLAYDKFVGFKDNFLLRFLGDISFSIYISHYLVIKALETYRPGWWWGSVGINKFILATVICVLIATILHFFVERPFITYGKKIEKNISSRGVAAKQLINKA